MKVSGMIIFLLIVLSVYALVNIYIFIRGWQALQLYPAIKPWYLIFFLILALSFVAGRISERYGFSIAGNMLIWIGSFWLGAMLYFFLLILFADIFRLGNYFFHFFPGIISDNPAQTKFFTFLTVVSITGLLLIYGYVNAGIFRIKKVDVEINARNSSLQELNIVMLSDLHLGTIIGKKKLKTIVSKANSLNPDIVILAGDVVDENIAPVMKLNLGEMLSDIKSTYGTYAITGNHEFIGGAAQSIAYLEQHGLIMLRDTAILVHNEFWLVGRNDRDMHRFTGRHRKSLEALMQMVDKDYPVILLDHQPFSLEKSAAAGVDLQLSGHTHHGQIFPLNMITAAIYKPDHGYHRIANTHFYISQGIGTWGPPIRIGSHPEIVNIKLRFRNDQ